MDKYKSEVERKFRLLKEQREDVEAEWTTFKEGFVGTAEEMCGRTSGKPTQSRKNSGGGTRKLNMVYKKRRRH